MDEGIKEHFVGLRKTKNVGNLIYPVTHRYPEEHNSLFYQNLQPTDLKTLNTGVVKQVQLNYKE